jgi:hypothetical protein
MKMISCAVVKLILIEKMCFFISRLGRLSNIEFNPKLGRVAITDDHLRVGGVIRAINGHLWKGTHRLICFSRKANGH